MGEEVFFHIASPGYEYPKDGFDNRGTKLRPVPGGRVEIKLRRVQVAERLYRVTGAGIYRDTLLAGLKPPIQHPVLNGQVLGQDTVIVAPYRGRLHWCWGDTDRASYPLGNFGASGATSGIPGRGGLDPAVGIDLTYFVGGDGFCRPMCPESEFGKGLKWIEGLMTVRDKGAERLVARVAAGASLGPTREWHLAVFNDARGSFDSVVRWDLHDGHDSSHPFHARVGGVEYLYLYPNYRVPATLEALRDLGRYEAFTCVAGAGRLEGKERVIDRDPQGRVRYRWKAGADRLHAGRLEELVASGRLKREECWLRLVDIETGAPVSGGRGSVCWNPFLRRWVMVASGKPGEVWISQADAPTGPWVNARRVAEHGRYNFYNPTQHPFFDEEGGRIIYFEGTYTEAFSGAPAKTPRYDYNQILYRLEVDDSRVRGAVPFPPFPGEEGAALPEP